MESSPNSKENDNFITTEEIARVYWAKSEWKCNHCMIFYASSKGERNEGENRRNQSTLH